MYNLAEGVKSSNLLIKMFSSKSMWLSRKVCLTKQCSCLQHQTLNCPFVRPRSSRCYMNLKCYELMVTPIMCEWRISKDELSSLSSSSFCTLLLQMMHEGSLNELMHVKHCGKEPAHCSYLGRSVSTQTIFLISLINRCCIQTILRTKILW